MVGELIALNRLWRVGSVTVIIRFSLDKRDALLVVHDMQRLALQGHRDPISAVFAVDFKAPYVHTFVFTGRRLPSSGLSLGYFADALTGGVVNVVRHFGCATVVDYL